MFVELSRSLLHTFYLYFLHNIKLKKNKEMLYAIFYVDCQKWDSLGVSGALVLLKQSLTLRFSIHSFKLICF